MPTLRPMSWSERNTVLSVSHVMGLVYSISHVGNDVRCVVAGETIYEGTSVDAAKQAAHNDALARIEEMIE